MPTPRPLTAKGQRRPLNRPHTAVHTPTRVHTPSPEGRDIAALSTAATLLSTLPCVHTPTLSPERDSAALSTAPTQLAQVMPLTTSRTTPSWARGSTTRDASNPMSTIASRMSGSCMADGLYCTWSGQEGWGGGREGREHKGQRGVKEGGVGRQWAGRGREVKGGGGGGKGGVGRFREVAEGEGTVKRGWRREGGVGKRSRPPL